MYIINIYVYNIMDINHKIIVNSIGVAIIINLVLPYIIRPFATEQQIKPPNGAENLSFFDQLMHMFVHHAQVPITSSLIVAIIVGLSVYIGILIK